MTVTELAALVVVITASVATTVLMLLCWDLRRTTRQLRSSARAMEEEAAVLVEELRTTLQDARRSLGHAEDHLERAGQVVDVIDQASKLTYRAVAGPVIKAAAVANGVRKGAEFLRGGPRDPAQNHQASRNHDQHRRESRGRRGEDGETELMSRAVDEPSAEFRAD